MLESGRMEQNWTLDFSDGLNDLNGQLERLQQGFTNAWQKMIEIITAEGIQQSEIQGEKQGEEEKKRTETLQFERTTSKIKVQRREKTKKQMRLAAFKSKNVFKKRGGKYSPEQEKLQYANSNDKKQGIPKRNSKKKRNRRGAKREDSTWRMHYCKHLKRKKDFKNYWVWAVILLIINMDNRFKNKKKGLRE